MAVTETMPPRVADAQPTWVSLGGGCQVAHQLRRRALRRRGMPLDWIRTPVAAIPALFRADFRDFLLAENMVLRPGPPRALVDRHYGIVMPHDVETYATGGHDALTRRYEPRVEALRSSLGDNSWVVLVRRRISIRDAMNVLAAAQDRYVGARIHLVAVNDEGDAKVRIEERALGGGGLLVVSSPTCGSHWTGHDATWDAVLHSVLKRLGLTQPSPRPALASKIARALLSPDWESVEVQLSGLLAGGGTNEVPPVFVRALIAAEDHRFWLHRGFDTVATLRAVFGLLTRRNLGGGSTIEQQLYRTLSGRRARSVGRKLKEMVGARLMGASVPKQDLAKLYLLVAYYGAGMNGFDQACFRLGVRPASAGEEEAAGLTARLKYPEPSEKDQKWQRHIATRTQYILRRMRKA